MTNDIGSGSIILAPPRPASGVVHWVGTGRSTGSGLRAVSGRARSVYLWGRSEDRAQECLRRVGAESDIAVRRFDPDVFATAVQPGDVVVSMVPATEHPGLLAVCVRAGAHFVCSSYLSPDMDAFGPEAGRDGCVVLTEVGLDPGLDHLFARDLVDQARTELGDRPAAYRLTSFCGGLPATPNPFRYRFSWAPVGVLTALRSPARYVESGRECTADRPWEAVRPHTVGEETFEVYPNRDSLPFVEAYGLPTSWRAVDFIRGTLRLDGWHAAWSEVFETVSHGDDDALRVLAAQLAERHPMRKQDRDRVVLDVRLEVRADDGTAFTGTHTMDLVGDEDETAMSRSVSRTLACGVGAVLDSRLAAGVSRAVPATEARIWLDELSAAGLVSQGQTTSFD